MENLDLNEQRRFEKAKKRVRAITGFYKHFAVYILINLFLIGAKYFNLDSGEVFWKFSTFSTTFWWGIGVVCHAFGVFGTGLLLGQNWEEKKIQEIMDKQKNTKWE